MNLLLMTKILEYRNLIIIIIKMLLRLKVRAMTVSHNGTWSEAISLGK